MEAFLPLLLTLPAVLLVLWGAHWLLLKRHTDLGSERKFPRQLTMLGLTLAGILAVALVLPVNVSTRNQLVAFIGLIVSGIFAFASTTLFANLVAGVMLRIARRFRSGDFIEVEGKFGRVSGKGLFDTEIQTENSDLISIPNLFLVTHPVSVTRASGTIVSASLSLGYDLHHAFLEPLMLQAAESVGLEEPYVYVTGLGDYSVTYRVHGMLRDIKSLLSARSALHRSLLDVLHQNGVEIVSPSFMNQRPLPAGERFLPQPPAGEPQQDPAASGHLPEDRVFDKAEAAEQREKEMQALDERIRVLEEQIREAGSSRRPALEAEREAAREARRALESEPEEPAAS